MKTSRHILALVLLLAGLLGPNVWAGGDGSFPGIHALMTPEEFRAAGLDRLSPAELEALDRWLVKYTAGEARVLARTDEEVKQAAAEEEIVSVIEPPFTGWDGDTIFRLANGQVWQQRRAGRYVYQGSNPAVRITRNLMGFYRMELVENGKAVLVRRLQ